jgi:putative thioredoxin
MMTTENIIDANELDFEYEVITYSNQMPVIVDFWAEWCGPCKVLGPILEQLTAEGQGSFRLAKVNVDENPNLALRFGVRSIPTVKAFRDGQVVSEFMGAQPESRIREFIKALAPSKTDLILEKAQSQLDSGDWSEAEVNFREFLSNTPDYPPALLGLARSSLLQGQLEETKLIIENFPASKEYNSAMILQPLINSVIRIQGSSHYSDDPLEAAYQNALRLFLLGNYPAMMDGILDVLRQDKHYKDEEARYVLLGLFEALGDNYPLTRQYRNELASVLF